MMDTRRRLMMGTGSKPFVFDTDFSEKEADWIEEGGTFTFGSTETDATGLYQAINIGKTAFGTIKEVDNYCKYLTIPILLKEFNGEIVTNIYSSANNQLCTIGLRFLDKNQNTVFEIAHTDGWASDKRQAQHIWDGSYGNGGKKLADVFIESTAYNAGSNTPLTTTFSYKEGVFTVSSNPYTSASSRGTATATVELGLPEIHFIRIKMSVYSTYKCPRMNVASLAITPA